MGSEGACISELVVIFKDMTNTLITKTIFITCGLLLFVAAFNLPIGYYTFLRISVFIGAFFVIMNYKNKGVSLWQILFGLIGILFNPIFPIYLHSKQTWTFIDLACGLLFFIKAFTTNNISKTT
jgi:hypothetical protein